MGPLQAEQVRELCSDRNCRVVLAVLAAHRRTLTVNDLTSAVVKHELGTSMTEVDGEAVTAIERDLTSEQLPKLADAGLVAYDGERRLVEPGDHFEAVRSEIEEIVANDDDLDTPVEL